MTHWPKRLHEAKALTGLDFTQFGAAVGLSRETVRRPREPTVTTALQAALSLGLTVDQLLGKRRITALGLDREVKQIDATDGGQEVYQGWDVDNVTIDVSRFVFAPVLVERTKWLECCETLCTITTTMSEAAAAAGVEPAHFRAWVNGLCETRAPVAVAVAKRCGLTLHEMLTVGITDIGAVAKRLEIQPC